MNKIELSTMYGTFAATTHKSTPDERPYDGYEALLEYIKKSFNECINDAESLFTTDAKNLYDIFLNNLPYEARQHYNCNTCRNFVERYGNLVTISKHGIKHPVMWTFTTTACPFFTNAIIALYDTVRAAKVTGVFIPDQHKLGVPRTGEWTHMAVTVPKRMVNKSKIHTAEQVMAEKKEDFKMLTNAINKYKLATIETAVNLLRSNSLYRSEKHLGIAEWFLKVKNDLKYCDPDNINKIWKYVAKAPAGFCHISSSMIGTLLDDIEEGYDYETVKARFDEKMNPLKYQRPKVAPSFGNVKRAEEIIAKLGLASSLKRRFARLEDLNLIWKPTLLHTNDISTGVFAGIRTKETNVNYTRQLTPRTVTMTWEKFQRTVLPMAKKIELLITASRNSYAAITTAEDLSAPPIIQWDSEDTRNPLGWYLYNNGSTPGMWNLTSGRYVEVTGITLQPNMYTPGFEHQGKGVMFVLKGCKDQYNKSLALFPETLRHELREVRATIEEYSRTHELSGYEEASACGLLLQDGNNWRDNCTIKVTTALGVTTYKLDRWD